MSNKRTIPTDPYFPVAGESIDSSGLHLELDQATLIQNLRIHADRLETRGGDKRFALKTPSGDPIIHLHTFKDPEGSTILFAFTRSGIYRYNSGDASWISALGQVTVDTCETPANWAVSPPSQGQTVADVLSQGYPYKGDYSVNVEFEGHWTGAEALFNAGDSILKKTNLDVDLSRFTHLVFWLNVEEYTLDNVFDIAVELRDSSGVTLLGGPYLLDTTPDSGWREVRVPIDLFTANLGQINIYAAAKWTGSGTTPIRLWFSVDNFYLVNLTAGISDLISNPVSFWSTTDFVDNNIGATVVAAGSDPNLPNQAEDDGGRRVLLYYDQGLQYFLPIQQKSSAVTVPSNEVIGTGAPAQVTFTGTLVNFPIVQKSLSFSTLKSDDTELSVDDLGDGTFEGDGTGSIDYDTGVFSITFDQAPKTSEPIYAGYSWFVKISILPRLVANFNNRLILIGEYSDSTYYPWRVRYSDVADIATYSLTTNWVDRVDTDISPFKAVGYIGPYLVLVRELSIEVARYTGDATVFTYKTTWNEGTLIGKSWFFYGNLGFGLTRDDVVVFDGNQIVSISKDQRTGKHRVRQKIFDLLNNAELNNCFAGVDPKYTEYQLYIVETGQTYPTRIFVYNWKMDCWREDAIPASSCTGFFFSTGTTSWTSLIGAWEEQNWKWGEGILEGLASTPIIARELGDVYILDEKLSTEDGYLDNTENWIAGTAIGTELVTRDFTFSDVPRKDRCNRLEIECRGNIPIGISYSLDYGNSWSEVTWLNPSNSFEKLHYWPDVVCDRIRFKLVTEDVGKIIYRYFQPFAILKEKD